MPKLAEVEPLRNPAAGQPPLPLHLLELAVNVPGVFHVVHDLCSDLLADLGEFGELHDQLMPANFRSAQEFGQRHIVPPSRVEQADDALNVAFFRLQALPAHLVDESHLVRQRGETPIRIVLAQQQPVLGPAGEHPIRFVHAPGDQVIDHDPDVRLITAEDERIAMAEAGDGIRAGDQTLGGCLLIAGRAVDLAREEEPGHNLALERRAELIGGAVVVFDGIAVTHDLRMLQSRNQAEHGVLHIARQAGGDAVDIHLECVPALRFQEQLVRVTFAEPHDFGFDRGAVAWPSRLDLAAEHGSAIEIGADQLVHGRVGVGDPAWELVDLQAVGEKRKRLGLRIAGLHLRLRVVDGASVEPCGRAGLEPLDAHPQAHQRGAESSGGPLPCTPSFDLGVPSVHDCLQEGTCGQDDRRRFVRGAALYADSQHTGLHAAAFRPHLRHEVFHRLLAQRHIVLPLHTVFDGLLIGPFVRLRPGTVHRRSLAPIEHAELDPGGVDHLTHRAAQRIDLAYDLTLGHAADGRIAAHLSHRVQIRG